MQAVPGFEARTMEFLGAARCVYRAGSGSAVIVMSEMPGITPAVAAFARRVVEAGHTVFMPQLFGEPMRPPLRGYTARTILKACISREFRVLASDQSSPIVDWLRALARAAHAECGGRGVGAIGMCFTGNFALAMMLDAPVLAPVLSQHRIDRGCQIIFGIDQGAVQIEDHELDLLQRYRTKSADHS